MVMGRCALAATLTNR